MEQLNRAVVVVVACLSSAAFAQFDDEEHSVDVVMPGAAVRVQGGASSTVVVPGASMQVRTTTTSSSSHTGVVVGLPGVVVQPAPVVVREQVVVQQPVIVREQVVVQQPVVVQQQVLVRDCGTGPNDPGCHLRKHGQLPLDGAAFSGILSTLRAQRNTITREELAESMLGRAVLTAAQLGLVMDAFSDHGITQLDVAKRLAPNVVNPQHAMGHATKFRNSISAEEYVEVMAAQAPGH